MEQQYDDSSEFKLNPLAVSTGESTTKDGDESSISSASYDKAIISEAQIMAAPPLPMSSQAPTDDDFADRFTLDGDNDDEDPSILIINAAHVIDDVENADVLEFRRFSRINLEEKLEIIGISQFRRHHRYVEPSKTKQTQQKRRWGIRKMWCKYSTCCYLLRCPSCLEDLPLFVKGPALVALILLAIAFVTIVAALIVHTMMEDENNAGGASSSSSTRGFDSSSSLDEFALPHQSFSSSHNVSESTSSHNFYQPGTTHPPSPWGAGDHAADPALDETIKDQPANNTLDYAGINNNKSSNTEATSWILLLEPVSEQEVNDQQQINDIITNDQPLVQANNEHWVDEEGADDEPVHEQHVNEIMFNGPHHVQVKNVPSKKVGKDERDDEAASSDEIPEYKANIFVQQSKVLDQDLKDNTPRVDSPKEKDHNNQYQKKKKKKTPP
jgi:hypothetical protein